MGHKPRADREDQWHHVYHRGIAQRTTFETRREIRFFFALLAQAVRAGVLEVHAHSLLTNHLHLLLRSLCGRMSEELGRILSVYTRFFNRPRRRLGALFAGRFKSKPVDSHAYRCALVRYIDENAVVARLVERPEDYPYGSARFHSGAPGAPWLARDWVREEVERVSKRPFRPEDYALAFPARLPAPVRGWIEQRMSRGAADHGEIDDLINASPEGLRRLWEERARNADGRTRPLMLVPPEAVDRAIRVFRLDRPASPLRFRGPGRLDPWDALHLGIRRDLCGLSARELGIAAGLPRSTVQSRLAVHAEALSHDPNYRVTCRILTGLAVSQMRSMLTEPAGAELPAVPTADVNTPRITLSGSLS